MINDQPIAGSMPVAGESVGVASGLDSDNLKGFLLAVISSAFIGASFIVKKKGLKRAGASGNGAGSGGYGYLLEPLWWVGMITMIVGEIANFVAYIFAPAVLVTPLGALSIIVSAILAHFILKERLQRMGVLGCVLCIVGSTVIVLHAPEESTPTSVEEIWELATQPAFLLYTASAVAIVLVLMLHCAPRYGQTNIMIYLGICSVIGSLTVMSIKAIGIAIKLTLEGQSQIGYFQTWVFAMVAITCIVTQLNYLNKALDTFNTAVVSPIYYAMFTTLTILASAIMFKDWSGQSASSIASEICGLITVLSGTTVLHTTREPDPNPSSAPTNNSPSLTLSPRPHFLLLVVSGKIFMADNLKKRVDLYTPLSPKILWHIQGNGELWKHSEDGLSADFITILRNDYFT